jgi:hypothetical protein
MRMRPGGIGATLVSLVGASILAALPASGAPEPLPEPAPAAQEAVTFRFQYFEVTGGRIVRAYANDDYLGSIRILVYPPRTAKHIQVCDMTGALEQPTGFSPGVHIDPTGAGPPDIHLYIDTDYEAGTCMDRTLGYPVRKWRPVIHVNRTPSRVGGWQIRPLPYPDY